MQNRKNKNNSNSFQEPPKLDSLRKITASDRFPCFTCYDDPREKLACQQCRGNGWISGLHPMVQFAEDFIEKRIGALANSDMNNSSAQNSDFGQIGVHMGGSYDPRKKPSDMFPTSSKTVALVDQIRQSNKSSGEQALQQQYFCDQCQVKDPIKGKRYHCLQCDDYDLCQSCFNTGVHNMHKFKEWAAIRKPDSEAVVKQIKDILLKKSIRYCK